MKHAIQLLASVALLALSGCNARIEQQPSVSAKQVFYAPAVYGTFEPARTRAYPDEPCTLGDGHNGFTSVPTLGSLPAGTTLWVSYQKALDTAPATPDVQNPAHWETEKHLQAFRVLVSDKENVNALAPVRSRVVTEGGVDYEEVEGSGEDDAPLSFSPGKYLFRAVWPANRIRKSDLSMQVKNGMQVYSNDLRYTQTLGKVQEIVAGNGVQNVVLNPMINQTARIKISVRPQAGQNLDLKMLSQGIEVSGLQTPEKEESDLAYKWSSSSVADTLVMKFSDKHARTFIREFTTEGDRITGSACFLPTNAMSTMVLILVNVAVNGIPTQYTVPIYRTIFNHAHSYNLDLEVGLNGQIRVLAWSTQSWTGEIQDVAH